MKDLPPAVLGATVTARARREQSMRQLRERISKLYIYNKMSTEKIAKEVGLGSRKAVEYHLKKIREEWKANTLRAFSDLRSEQLAELDRLYEEAINAWERSKTEKTTRVNKAKGPAGAGASPTSAEAATRTEEQVGNPAFLDLALKIAERKAKLLGTDAPTRIETSGPGGGPLQFALRADPKAVEERIADLDARRALEPPALSEQLAARRAGELPGEIIDVVSSPGPGAEPDASAPGPGLPSSAPGPSAEGSLSLSDSPPDPAPLERRPGPITPQPPIDTSSGSAVEKDADPTAHGEGVTGPPHVEGSPAGDAPDEGAGS